MSLALVKGQLSFMASIEKAYETFKKSPKERLRKESYLVTRIESLEEKWKIVVDNHRKLLEMQEIDKTTYMTENVFQAMEEVYIEYKSELREYLSEVKLSKLSTPTPSCSHTSSKVESSVRLPKIIIPTFSGSYTEWTTFKDLYVSLIHKNSSIDQVQKMHYLKGHLTGEAEQLLRHVPITAASYDEAWSTLNSRYNNKKYLANCLLKRFMNQPSIGSESCSAIKEMLDVTNETLNGLKNLGVSVSTWDTIVIYIICSKLDSESRKEWEMKISVSDELPALSQLREFLESRFRALEFMDPKPKTKPNSSTQKPKVLHALSTGSDAVSQNNCPYCKKNEHKLANCKQFSANNYDTRHEFVQTNSLCFNCLGRNHSAFICKANSRCQVCKRKHHSLLHPTQKSSSTPSASAKSELEVEVKQAVEKVKASQDDASSSVKAHFSQNQGTKNQILLATAVVGAQAGDGRSLLLRALIDQGSQASFVTESAVQMLGLRKILSKSSISGVGGGKGNVASKHIVMVNIQSRHDPSFELQVRAHVLGAITSLLPSQKVEYVEWPELEDIVLADPQFHTPNKIDILLGADLYGKIIREGLIRGPNGTPIAQCTALGWILSGPTHDTHSDEAEDDQHCHHNVVLSMHGDELLKQFWQIESDLADSKILTEEEQCCEEFYSQTTQRDGTGRYIVRLPFREEDPQCKYGKSKEVALKRFHHLENRFKKNPEIKSRYSEVIHEYLDLGHMVRVTGEDRNKADAVYLPHHAVIREDRTTTKVRVVFDASCKGKNGVSLNDTLMIGPRLQQDLRHIIIRWRMHPICLSADIVKMYRQVIVADEDADFQRLVWRDDPESEIEEYKLVRVTFGTSPAPYLAVKTLQQIASDEGMECPDVAEKVKSDFYVDDLLTGCQTVEEGKIICKVMKGLLNKGGFELQKWASNNEELAAIMTDHEEIQDGKVDIKIDDVVKVLGLTWDKRSDAFHYSVQLPDLQNPITKRKVISNISRLFDPLGWVTPCIVVAKVMIQKLWLAGIDWDDELPEALLEEWLAYESELKNICEIRIPRWLEARSNDSCMELQGFCDASIAAYAAVVYLRTIDVKGNIHVNLIAAKTKVAPTMQVSIPRLELMGAVLLAKLITDVAKLLGIDKDNIHGWTDSTVVLAWLSSHPSRWSTFIGNRTSDILSKLDNAQWSHVQSAQNPADIASRGCTPLELAENKMWLQGPSWLKESKVTYHRPTSSTDLEQRKIKVHFVAAGDESSGDPDLWTRFSTLRRLVRVVAYCRRFLKYKRNYKFEPYLTSHELNAALEACIRQSQLELQDSKNKLKSLSPFLDDKKIMRVGGRIENSNLPMDTKHPIILPHKSHLTKLIVDEAHKKTLHGGPTLMLNHLRTRYWIVSAKSLVKMHVRKCVVCVRHAATTKTPFMGQLPSCRVTPSRPFLHSGVDFAGPINIRMSKGRGNKSYKGYISIFVCMATKAIHLEVISDLTAEGFIAGFKRFVARRGHVSEMWSDNGTNFVAASKELLKLVTAEESSVALEIREWLSSNSVVWHFIPAHAPNFGGLWEAGVKATKFHLKRVIGDSTLTYEELTTVLTQIEACLNSRPLSILPNIHSEPAPLTPGHFLIGEPLVIVPERNYELSNISSLRRWQVTQRMVQDFWRRWSNEYLVHCLQRYKWSNLTPEPKIGDVVLVKEDNLPPAHWMLGRVVDKHPGSDQITRVVTLKCGQSLFKRPTSKLCVLPVTD